MDSAEAASGREFAIARDLGFDISLTSRQGVLKDYHDEKLHSLPRISVNGKFQSVRYVKTLMSACRHCF